MYRRIVQHLHSFQSPHMVFCRSVASFWLVFCMLHSRMPAHICHQSNPVEALQVSPGDISSQGPTVRIIFPEFGAIISDSKWTMRLEFSNFEGMLAIVMFGTGQSLNLNSLSSSFSLFLTDFENGPYDVSVLMLDSNRNPLGGAGEARVSFSLNASVSADASRLSGMPAASHLPHRLNAPRHSRPLALNVLRIALSYSRSIDAKM